LASLFSDWSHEIATAVLPTFLATMGVAAAWLGFIEGISDGLSSFAKMASGYYTDRFQRRKPIAVAGYVVTALGTASFGLASAAWHVLLSRSIAWLGRGVRTPVRKALLAGAVTPETYGRAFGLERMMDTIGAIVGPASAVVLLAAVHHHYPMLFAWTLLPGLVASALMAFLVVEKARKPVKHISFGESLRALPVPFRKFLLAVGLFGSGDFAHSMLILLATQRLTPSLGATRAASVAVGLYLLHNVLYAGFAFVAGWLADRFEKRWLLALGYAAAALMAVLIITLPVSVLTLALIFALGGIHVAMTERSKTLSAQNWSARSITAWPLESWPRSTASATSSPAQSWACSGPRLARTPLLPIPGFFSSSARALSLCSLANRRKLQVEDCRW
jgi:MFS family permease